MVGDVDQEHDREDADRHQRGALLGEPIAPFLHAAVTRRLLGLDIERAGDQRVLGDAVAFEFANDAAVIKHQHAVAAADQFVIVGRIEQDRRAGIGQPPQQLIDLLLGADIDAARRIVEQDDARLAHQPFGDDHLLLVAARQRADRYVEAGRLDVEQLHHLVDQPLLLVAVDDSALRHTVQHGEGEVLAHRHRQHQALGLAVLRDQRHADRCRAGRRRGWLMAVGVTVDQDGAGRAAQHAEQRQQQVALTLPVQAAEADHFALGRPRS